MKNGINGIVAAVMAIVASLREGERIAVIIRHGSTGDMKDKSPADTICTKSYNDIRALGEKFIKAGLHVARMIVSPRGRAVKAAIAFAEGNSGGPGGELAPFSTNEALRDGSHDRPDLIARVKVEATAKGYGEDEAPLLSADPDVQRYMWERGQEHRRCFLTVSKSTDGVPAFVGHTPLLELGIAALRNHEATSVADLKVEKLLTKGGAAVVVFDAQNNVVKVVYL